MQRYLLWCGIHTITNELPAYPHCGYAGSSLEVKIETDSNDAVEIKTEADSNDITHYEQPCAGMFCFL